jgi:hypothetical protein
MTAALDDDPYRVAPQVPLALLPGTGCRVLPWRCPESARPGAGDALTAFDTLITAAGSPDRRDLTPALPAAVAALGELAAALAPEGAVVLAEQLPHSKLIHQYFGVRHCDDLPRAAVGFHAVLIARWCVAELEYAALDTNDILAALHAWRLVLAGLTEGPLTTGGPADAVAPPSLLAYLPPGDQWARWIVAHHGYLLANMLAAAEIDAAIDCITAALPLGAEKHLRNAAVYVRALTALMLHSAALPDRTYLDEIRPSMILPTKPRPTPLTGGSFFEHHRYRHQLGRLLRVTGPYEGFALRFPVLAELRDRLLDADLMDLYAHIRMGYTLVLDDRSLVQQLGNKDSAVAELTRMLLDRLTEFAPYRRLGAAQEVLVS